MSHPNSPDVIFKSPHIPDSGVDTLILESSRPNMGIFSVISPQASRDIVDNFSSVLGHPLATFDQSLCEHSKAALWDLGLLHDQFRKFDIASANFTISDYFRLAVKFGG